MNKTESELLLRCALFEGIRAADMPALLGCLAPQRRHCGKNQIVFAAGAPVSQLGVVLAGKVQVEQHDYWGNRTILAQLGPADLFAEAFSLAGTRQLPVSVRAVEESDVLLIDCRKLLTGCEAACAFHTRLIHNLMRILAQKNIYLAQKMETVTQRTTRQKLLHYLSGQARMQGENPFGIPFNRQELADYLSVDRSALSAELSKMRKEGLLWYHKNRFELH